MPVLISWDDEAKTTLRYEYGGKWTWDEVDAATDQVVNFMRETSSPVSIIHDMTHSPGLPSGALTQAHRFTRDLPENWEISVVVGSGTFTEALLNIFSRVYKKLGEHYKTASTLDEARAIIAAQKAKK
jgi:hypothetical protein